MTRKSSEPACRICGCTEYDACDEGCSWVKIESNSPPLCSACSGDASDMAESIRRGCEALKECSARSIDRALEIGNAALKRRDARAKADAANPDPAWGNR